MKKEFYDFEALDITGQSVSMNEYKDKVVLIVNTASACGLTPQYEGLEELYKKYQDKGLVILGFPCNQFGAQEPGDEKSISEGCLLNYGVTFKMFSKIDVNGKDAHSLYVYLKDGSSGLLMDDIKWNFAKFLINKDGKPTQRYEPTITPESLEKDILSAIEK
jgi:glutathione peroxidase